MAASRYRYVLKNYTSRFYTGNAALDQNNSEAPNKLDFDSEPNPGEITIRARSNDVIHVNSVIQFSLI